MGRSARIIHPGHLTEITIKTVQARFLLAPNKLVNSLIIGILGRAQRLFGLTICAVVFLSDHAHLLIVPDSAAQVAGFCQYLKSNLSLEIGRRLRRWTGGLFRTVRYSDIVVSCEAEAHALIDGDEAAIPPPTSGKDVLHLAGIVDDESAHEAMRAIREGCKQVDLSEW